MSESVKEYVLITGASSGLGRSLAYEYAKRGQSLVLVARRRDELEKIKLHIEGTHSVTVVILALDVTSEHGLKIGLQDFTKNYGQLKTVILCASAGVSGYAEFLRVDDYKRQFDVNVFGAIRSLHAVLPYLKHSKGSLCFIGGTSSYMVQPENSAFSMSQFAVRAFANSLYFELAPYDISVTLVHPDGITTELGDSGVTGISTSQNQNANIPESMQISSRDAAEKIIRAIQNKKREITLTRHSRVGIFLAKHFYGVLAKILRKNAVKPVRPRKIHCQIK